MFPRFSPGFPHVFPRFFHVFPAFFRWPRPGAPLSDRSAVGLRSGSVGLGGAAAGLRTAAGGVAHAGRALEEELILVPGTMS